MGTITDIEANLPHMAEMRICECGHMWCAVYPVNTPKLECPKCHEMHKNKIHIDRIAEKYYELFRENVQYRTSAKLSFDDLRNIYECVVKPLLNKGEGL